MTLKVFFCGHGLATQARSLKTHQPDQPTNGYLKMTTQPQNTDRKIKFTLQKFVLGFFKVLNIQVEGMSLIGDLNALVLIAALVSLLAALATVVILL